MPDFRSLRRLPVSYANADRTLRNVAVKLRISRAEWTCAPLPRTADVPPWPKMDRYTSQRYR